MKLSQLLSVDQILLEMKAVAHWPAITELVDHLVASGRLEAEQRGPVLAALREREDLVSTGIGSGVAIPHAFMDELDEVVAVLGCSRAGVDFDSLDHAPVHFIVLFLVPRTDYPLHLRTLAAIAKMFTNREIRQRMSSACSAEEMLAIFSAKGPTSHLVAPATDDLT